MNCKNFKIRTKYYYCTKQRKIITFDDCKSCPFKEYKEYKRLEVKKEYKYKPKKSKCSNYYNDISIMPKSPLYSTKKVKFYEKHHIFDNVANIPKSKRYGLFIWVNEEQHRYLTDTL